MTHPFLPTGLAVLARWYPWPVTVSEELRRAVSELGWETTGETVVKAGYVAGVLAACLTVLPGLRLAGPPGGFVAIALGLGLVHAVHTGPVIGHRIQRTRALGDAPGLLARGVMRMRVTASPETAATFAAKTGDGPLAASLARHVRRGRHTGQSGLSSFVDDWGERFVPLSRAVALLPAAASAPPDRRDHILDRALSTVLDGTREEMRSFAAEIRGPTTALYAFGVLLPTALVALLPAAGAAGLAIAPATVVLTYNMFLPALLVATGAWLLSQRPLVFPPPDARSHPSADVSKFAVVAGPAVGIAAWIIVAPLVPWWGPPIAALGLGLGSFLWLYYRPVVAVYDEIHAGEAALPAALSLTGRRIAEGQSVEAAMASSEGELDGPLGAVFAETRRQQRQRKVGLEAAMFGDYGTLQRLPSRRIQSSMQLLVLAATAGRPAGDALLSLADHLTAFDRIQREARHELAYVCRTLSSTALLFGPLVAGATVALGDGMAGEAFAGEAVSLSWLGGPIGVYVLVMAVVLTGLATGLRRGLDRTLLGVRIGRALCGATIAYLGAYLVVGLI